jgi:hypothetical protein
VKFFLIINYFISDALKKRQKTSKGKEKAFYIKQIRASLTGIQKQEVYLKKL